MKIKIVFLIFLSIFIIFNKNIYGYKSIYSKKIFIKSVETLHFVENIEPPLIRAMITFKSISRNSVRIQEGKYKVYLNPDNKGFKNREQEEGAVLSPMEAELLGEEKEILTKRIYIGTAYIASSRACPSGFKSSSHMASCLEYLEIPPKDQVTKIIEIHLPKRLEQRVRVLYVLFNYMGFSKACSDLAFEGKATIGIKTGQGWTYMPQTGQIRKIYQNRSNTPKNIRFNK